MSKKSIMIPEPSKSNWGKRGKGRGSPEDVTMGQRVRARRLELHLSQSALGKAMDLTFQQVQKYEKGTNRISAGRLVQLSRILDVPVEYFLTGLGDDQSPITNGDAAFAKFLATKDGVAIIEAMLSIKKSSVRTKAIELVRLLGG